MQKWNEPVRLFFISCVYTVYLNIPIEELTLGTSSLLFSRATKHNHSRKHVYTGSGKLERVCLQVNFVDTLYLKVEYIPSAHKSG